MAEGGDFSQNTLFIRNKDLPSNRDAKVTDYDLYEAINDVLDTENGIRCIQREGEIWRLELESAEDCNKLKEEGIEVNEPFPKGVKIPTVQGKEKILICGLPYSVENNDIEVMLEQLGVIPLGGVRTEEICDPDTNTITLVTNGNKYVFIFPLDENKCLPRNVTCAGFKCRLYHSEQETRTSEVKCYDKVCRVCFEPDHDPTSPNCWYNTNQSEDLLVLSKTESSKTFPCPITVKKERKINVVVLNEETNPLSMSFPRQFIFEDKPYNSAKEAYQTKRIGGKAECPSSVETSNIFEDNNLEVKGWTERKDVVMKKILKAKFNQVTEIHELLKSIGIRTAEFAEATDDDYWGTGLSREETEQTHPSQWPGENRLGRMIKEIASEIINIPKITFYTLNAGGLRNKKRRDHLFTWLQTEAFDIVFLQETGFDVDMDSEVRSEHFDFHHCFAVKKKRWNCGVSILLKKTPDFPFKVKKKAVDNEEGRMLSLHVTYKKKKIVLINIYANSGNSVVKERKAFFTEVFNFIEKEYRNANNIILGGDFNCKLDSDKSDVSRDFLRASLSTAKLRDSWKDFKKNEEGFTCKQKHRIDYIFLHDNLISSFINMCLLTPPSLQNGIFFSDHDGIYFELGTSG